VRLRARRPARAAAWSAARAGAVALGASLALAACEGGAIGQSTAASNGQSFVSGNASTTVYGATSGPAAPHVTGTLLTGSKFALAQYRGHVVVLNFWGSWCTPCRAEAPSLSQLARHFTARGVRFLGVDIRDSPATAEAFQRDFRIGYPSLNDPGDEIALDFRDTVPPAGIPTTLVIGRNGRITARIIGQVSYPGLHGLISKALAQPA
jgi:thiol-disulfide isomerase/thioredoxin